MQGALFYLGLLASSAVGFVAADDLKIDVTRGVECERKTVKGDRISVHYRGSLQATGAEFDASYNRGKPFQVKIGAGQVIQGWEQGLLDMTLTIPPELGYGQRGMGPIPAGSVLIFETELMGIDGVPTPENIVYKEATEAAGEVKEEAEGVAQKVAEKIVSAAGEAVDAAKTIVADGDDSQEHNEL
ncbi:FK506-binding protein [Plectosphaerella plurivora]|uniref:peptidylprolyl isomerase n=1 Tax=Plectosphaerella plurivora TaxID=936078 RepID=A0A9P8VJF1_9PEZI|nr:FK506-binding protein [Plectosphaerella plurivora]